jgi:hypothetical protein
MIIPGTWYNANGWSSSGSESAFVSAVGKTFNDSANTQVVSWSGKDQDSARQNAAQSITNTINNYKFAEGEKLNIVGHSHGGNIGNLVSQMTNHKIDNLVTLGTPVISDYAPNSAMIGRNFGAYSSLDTVQVLGGKQTSGPAAIGAGLGFAICGGACGLIGAITGRSVSPAGEFGPAGRVYSGATGVNVTWQSGLLPISAHTEMPNTSAWSKIDKQINKK